MFLPTAVSYKEVVHNNLLFFALTLSLYGNCIIIDLPDMGSLNLVIFVVRCHAKLVPWLFPGQGKMVVGWVSLGPGRKERRAAFGELQ